MIALHDRQSHLESMGVHQWYARIKLDGAQSTPDWVLSDAEVQSSVVQPSAYSGDLEPPINAVEDTNSVSHTMSAMDILKKGGLSSGNKESERSLSQSSIKAHDQNLNADLTIIPELSSECALESFSLVMYQTTQGLVISESVAGQSHPSELLLLKNILKSKQNLYSNHRECEFHQVLNWPVFRSLNLQSKQENDLRGLLSAWFRTSAHESVGSVFYFGSAFPDIQRYFADLSLSESVSVKFVSFKHSLADLIQFPQRKAEVWAEICSLYGE